MSARPLKLRPHHAVCIRYFRGMGYSEEFTANMQKIIHMLEHDDPEVMLLPGCDAVCGHCPHDRGGLCRSADKVRGYDLRVLQLLGLHPGAVLRWSALRGLVTGRILEPRRRKEICRGCEWSDFCQ